jgi:hypothetical protein
VLLGVKALGAQRNKQANTLRTQAAEAVSKAVGLSMLAVAGNPSLLSLCAQLGGKKPETITARAKYYSQLAPESLSHYIQSGSPLVVAAHTIALLTDLPARWLFDTATNRTGAERSTNGRHGRVVCKRHRTLHRADSQKQASPARSSMNLPLSAYLLMCGVAPICKCVSVV